MKAETAEKDNGRRPNHWEDIGGFATEGQPTSRKEHADRNHTKSSLSAAIGSMPHIMIDKLNEIDEEEALPLRPVNRVQKVSLGRGLKGASGLFGSSDGGQSEVREQSMRDENNDSGIAELIYGIR